MTHMVFANCQEDTNEKVLTKILNLLTDGDVSHAFVPLYAPCAPEFDGDPFYEQTSLVSHASF